LAGQYKGFTIYSVGSSDYYLQLRWIESELDCYFAFFKGCPKSDGHIVPGGFEEIFLALDDFDKEVAIFNLDLFRGSGE
jgi:hypothetical protein